MFRPSCVFLIAVFAQTSLQTAQADTCDVNSSCRYENRIYSSGSQWTPEGACKQLTCDDGKILELECKQFKLKECCCLTDEDLSKNYPDCCQQPQCPCENPKRFCEP